MNYANKFKIYFFSLKITTYIKKNFFVLAIRALASKLVEQWLKTVKGENVIPVSLMDIPQIIAEAQNEIDGNGNTKSASDLKTEEKSDCPDKNIKLDDTKAKQETNAENLDIERLKQEIKDDTEKNSEVLPVLKISVKDGKQILSQVDDKGDLSDKEKSKEKHRNKSRESDKSSSSSKSSNSSKHSSKSHYSSSDKHKNNHKSSSSSRHSSKDRSKDKEKHSSHSKSKSDSSKKSSEKSSSSSKTREDKNAKSDKKDKHKDDKNRDSSSKSNENTEEKPQSPPSIHKLGKIPKLSDSKKEKLSISIEVRKPDEPKPKTVKTFHSKFRKHGLEEEVKPPPSRATLLNKKAPPVLPPSLPAPKRPSPVHNETPPEKKPKTDPIEKPGSIKLIPPKPKRKYIYEIAKITINIFFIFPGEHCYPDLLVIFLSSSLNSLGCVIGCGKSKIYNLTGSKLLTVKYLMQINAEITI